MSTLLNIKTGQTVHGNTNNFTIKGDVVQDANNNLYVVKQVSFEYTDLYTVAIPMDITTIAVAFENNINKLYHYFIDIDELRNYKINDKIKINTPFGVSTVILKDKNISIDNSRATKLIDILPTTPKPSYKTVATVTFEGSIDYYHYIVDDASSPVKVNHKYLLLPNRAIVTVVDIRKTNAEDYHYSKTFQEISQNELKIKDNRIIKILEEETMYFNTNKIFKNFEFGKINTDAVKFSLNGLAFKMSDGSYATYDIEKKEATDVSAFVMDTDFIFAMPVAFKDIKKGDIIKHLGKFMIVEGIFVEDKTISVIDPLAAEEKVLIPIKNAFGFSYYTKIVNIFDGADFKPSEDMPFGNMLPFMFMNENGKDNSMLLAMMMMNKDNVEMDFMKNPFMMMALLNK